MDKLAAGYTDRMATKLAEVRLDTAEKISGAFAQGAWEGAKRSFRHPVQNVKELADPERRVILRWVKDVLKKGKKGGDALSGEMLSSIRGQGVGRMAAPTTAALGTGGAAAAVSGR
jgi:hypothetical protein